jgi:elongation factor Ts
MPIDQIKQLREESGVSIIECQKALKEAGNDMAKAKEVLRRWGRELAAKKADRVTSQGIVTSYIHPNNKMGVLLELNSETDFAAKSADFKNLAHELCLQIAAMEEDASLLEQPWIKDPSKTIKDLINETTSKIGENITVKRFSKFKL